MRANECHSSCHYRVVHKDQSKKVDHVAFAYAVYTRLTVEYSTIDQPLISTNIQNFVQISQSTTQLFIITYRHSRWRLSDMFDFRNSEYWLSYHLRLLKFHHYTNLVEKNWSTPNLCPKRNSKWRPLPSWIYFRWLFLTRFWLYATVLISTITQNFMKISQSTTELQFTTLMEATLLIFSVGASQNWLDLPEPSPTNNFSFWVF